MVAWWRDMCQWTGLSLVQVIACTIFWWISLHSFICRQQYVHDDVIKWKHFSCDWPFVRVIHRSPVDYPHKGQWRKALMFSLICAWTNGWGNDRDAGDLRRHRAHNDVTVMWPFCPNLNALHFLLDMTRISSQFPATHRHFWSETMMIRTMFYCLYSINSSTKWRLTHKSWSV